MAEKSKILERPSRTERRLAAILAADVVGYSAMVGRDEEGAIAALNGCLEAMEPVIGMHGGRVVKKMGDGLLVEYASVVDAVASAHSMQRRAAERNRDLPERQAISFRIGVHVGDIVVDGADILGDGVNIAARLERLAEPGGVVISRRVHEDVAGKLDLKFENLGPRELKNIARPVHLYALAPEGAPARPPPLELPDKPSVAVLPFLNLSPDPEQDFFADGLTEDMISALSHVPWIFVIARNSSFTFKGMAVDIRKVGRDLGVRYVLTGSVRRAGDRLRITGQLIDAGSGAQIWSDRYDGALADVFDLQDQVTEAVATAIAPEIQFAELGRSAAKRPDSLTAYDHCLRAQAALNRAQTAEAADHLDRAIEAAPDYAKAKAMRAWCETVQIAWRQAFTDEETRVRALEFAEAALTSAANDMEVAAYAGYTLAFFGADIDRGMALVEEATKRCPSFAWAWTSAGILQAIHGDAERAIAETEIAIRLNPPIRCSSAR